MKKIWRICAAVLAAAVLTTAAGCSARKAANADSFEKQAKSAGFTVKAATGDNSGATKTLIATKDGTDVEVDFHQFANTYAAQNWYGDQKSSLTVGSGKTVVDSDAYNKYTMSNGEIRYVIVRMDTTALLCKTVASKQSDVDALLKAIHY